MRRQKDAFLDGIFGGALLGVGFIWLWEENKKHKNRIELLKKELDQGFNLDKMNLERDWRQIGEDVSYSYEKIVEENQL